MLAQRLSRSKDPYGGVAGRDARFGGVVLHGHSVDLDPLERDGEFRLEGGGEPAHALADRIAHLLVGLDPIGTLGGEGVERLASRLVSAVVVHGRVPQRPIEPRHHGLRVVCGHLPDPADEGVLEDILGDGPTSDPAFQEREERPMVRDEDVGDSGRSSAFWPLTGCYDGLRHSVECTARRKGEPRRGAAASRQCNDCLPEVMPSVIGLRPIRPIDPRPKVTIPSKLIDRDNGGSAARRGLRGCVVCVLLLGAGCGARSLTSDAVPRAPVSDASGPFSDTSAHVFDASPKPSVAAPLTITGAEAAGRLSRFLWKQEPDSALLASVDASPLATSDDVRRLALQMLADERSRLGVGAFFRWWLRLDLVADVEKDPTLFPTFNPAMKAAMAAEPEAFGVFVTLDGDHRYPTLMTAPFSFVNESLASVYGVAGVVGDGLRQVSLDPAQRAGLVTQLGLLARTHSTQNASASARGYFIARRLLCADAPEPPPGESGGEPPANMTNRQWIEATTNSASCQVCHAAFDPLGFSLGNFDAIGRFATTEHGQQVDVKGTMILWGSPMRDAVTFQGPSQLAALLATRPEAQTCFARQWLRFAVGRELATADEPSLTMANAQFHAADLSIRELIAAVASSEAFLAP